MPASVEFPEATHRAETGVSSREHDARLELPVGLTSYGRELAHHFLVLAALEGLKAPLPNARSEFMD
jgi:hypothetical protein